MVWTIWHILLLFAFLVIVGNFQQVNHSLWKTLESQYSGVDSGSVYNSSSVN